MLSHGSVSGSEEISSLLCDESGQEFSFDRKTSWLVSSGMMPQQEQQIVFSSRSEEEFATETFLGICFVILAGAISFRGFKGAGLCEVLPSQYNTNLWKVQSSATISQVRMVVRTIVMWQNSILSTDKLVHDFTIPVRRANRHNYLVIAMLQCAGVGLLLFCTSKAMLPRALFTSMTFEQQKPYCTYCTFDMEALEYSTVPVHVRSHRNRLNSRYSSCRKLNETFC